MMNEKSTLIFALVLVASLAISSCQAQDYDDDGYGGQGGQGDNDNYGSSGGNQGYGNDDGYSANAPQYQQNVDSDSSNNSPGGYSSSPQGGSDADGDYEGDDNSAAASSNLPTYARVKRSIAEDKSAPLAEPIRMRVKRHSKYIGPVYTYVKTDKHANFKWGVKHKVGKKHYG